MGELNIVPNTTEEVFLVRNFPVTRKRIYVIINRDFLTPIGMHLLEEIDYKALNWGKQFNDICCKDI